MTAEALRIGVYALIAAALAAFLGSAACYTTAIRREKTGPALAGRALGLFAALLLTLSLALLWQIHGGPPLTSMADFLILLALIQTVGTLALDYVKKLGLLTLGNSVAGAVILATALPILSPEPASREFSLHIFWFLASLVALEVSFLSIFTYLLLRKFLKSKGHLWLFELAPSLEVTRRTAMISLLLGFGLLTTGFLAGYLFARHQSMDRGWRLDATILLTTAAWASYLLTIVAGIRSRFHGRGYAGLNVASFLLLMLTLFSAVFFSGLHRNV